LYDANCTITIKQNHYGIAVPSDTAEPTANPIFNSCRFTLQTVLVGVVVVLQTLRRWFFCVCGVKKKKNFGLAVGQMSVHNKPVLTCDVCGARQHINALGNKAFRYRDVPTLEKTIRKLLTMGRGNITKSNWEAYGGLDPTQVMKRFNEVFIEPARLYWYRLRKVGITDPFSLPSDKLPPRFNYFWRGSNHWGDLRPTVETMDFLETHLCEQPPHDAR